MIGALSDSLRARESRGCSCGRSWMDEKTRSERGGIRGWLGGCCGFDEVGERWRLRVR